MPKFHDAHDTPWTIELTVASIKSIRRLADVDLLRLDEGDPPLITRLSTDPVLLCDVVFAACAAQAQERGITDEDFGRAMGGDALAAAHAALTGALTDFFRQWGRPDLARMMDAHAALIRQAIDQAATNAQALTGGAQSTNSPESPASTPTV